MSSPDVVRGCLAGIRSALFELDHAASSIKFNQAALIQHFAKLLSTTLDSRFHTRNRKAKFYSGFLVGESLQFHQSDRLSIVRRQTVNHWPKTLRKLVFGFCFILFDDRCLFIWMDFGRESDWHFTSPLG